MGSALYQLNVKLVGARPPVWKRLGQTETRMLATSVASQILCSLQTDSDGDSRKQELVKALDSKMVV